MDSTPEVRPIDFVTEIVPLDSLREHPRNYRFHPDDELEHIMESIRVNGFYRNIVVARDGTILAGHGVSRAARKMGFTHVPVKRLDIDPDDSRALKVLAGDNEIGHLSDEDDRALSEILKEIRETDENGLKGTGYDDYMLANLIFVTRPESEIQGFDEAAAWVGMPGYDGVGEPLKIIISFRTEEDRQEFAKTHGYQITGKTKSVWWPPKEKDDMKSVRFEASG